MISMTKVDMWSETNEKGGGAMKEKVKAFIQKYGRQLPAIALAVASAATMCCRGDWYQPEEPEGLSDFAKTK